MATTTTTPTLAPGQEEVEFKRRAFDLNKFERVSLTGKLVFTPAKDLDEALARVGNDQEKLLDLLNSGLKRNVVSEAKSALVSKDNPDIVTSAKAIMQFAANFKAIPPYNKIADKKEQKKAIFAFIRSNEALMAALRTIAAATPDVEDEDDDDSEE